MKIAKITISSFSIPNLSGSWTQRVNYFFSKNNNNDFYLISKSSGMAFEKYQNQFLYNEFRFLKYFRYFHLFAVLKKIISSHDTAVVAVYDNIKILIKLNRFIIKNKLQSRIKVVFFQCGFSYNFNNDVSEIFYNAIDTLVLLSEASYEYEKNRYTSYPCEVKILPNPIDYNKILAITEDDSVSLKSKMNLTDKKIFLWLSADRKKKGLDIILNIWEGFSLTLPDVLLLVIGNNPERKKQKQVIFMGQIPHNEVYRYMLISDVYVFPTLWKEGFGLSLAEACASGCFIIASDQGAVSEVLSHTKNKIVVSNPNMKANWLEGIIKANSIVRSPSYKRERDTSFLNYEQWAEKFKEIFSSISKQ